MGYFGNDGIVADQPEGSLRVHYLDGARIVAVVIHHDVARQQQADAEIGAKGAVRQGRVARAENDVRSEVDVQLGFHGLLDVDLGQHAKALFLEGRAGALESLVVRQSDGDAEAVAANGRLRMGSHRNLLVG